MDSAPCDMLQSESKKVWRSWLPGGFTTEGYMSQKFIVITPAKDEAQYLQKTIVSLVSQTVLPLEWVIVDDGSRDGTGNIAYDAALRHPWIQVVKKKETGPRDCGYGDTAAFCTGLNNVQAEDYDFIFRIDADIILGPRYFEGILNKFAANARLGIATGEVDELIKGKLFRLRNLPLGFNGMIKGWRRTCFREIGGIPKGLGWDGLDCFKAMMLGWQTITFEDEDLAVIHLRPEGSSVINRYHGWARHGRAWHFAGAHPLWVLASAFYHLIDRPYVLGSLCLLLGFMVAWLTRAERYEDKELREYLRAWQLKKLAGFLRLA
jgi:biofilm PGA synthesis N-glycosyltransferase PgaC